MSTFLSYLPKALLVVAAVAAAAAWPMHAWAGSGGVTAALVAAAVCLAGAVLGRIPHLFFRKGPDAIFHAALAGLGVRLLGTLAAAVPILLASDLPQLPFAICLLVTYFALLLLEVRDLVAQSRALHRPGAAPHAEAAPEGKGASAR